MTPTPKPTHKQEALRVLALAETKVAGLAGGELVRYLRSDLETLREHLEAIEELKQKRAVKKAAVTS